MCRSGIAGSTIQVGHYSINHCLWHNLSYQKYSVQRGTRTHDPQMPEYLSNIKVWCSTDWASRAHVSNYVTHISIVTCVSLCLCLIYVALCLYTMKQCKQNGECYHEKSDGYNEMPKSNKKVPTWCYTLNIPSTIIKRENNCLPRI